MDFIKIILNFVLNYYFTKNFNSYNYILKGTSDPLPLRLEAPSLSVLGASGAGIKDFLTIHFYITLVWAFHGGIQAYDSVWDIFLYLLWSLIYYQVFL